MSFRIRTKWCWSTQIRIQIRILFKKKCRRLQHSISGCSIFCKHIDVSKPDTTHVTVVTSCSSLGEASVIPDPLGTDMELRSSSSMSSSTTRSILNRLDQLLSDEATTTPWSTFQEGSVPEPHFTGSGSASKILHLFYSTFPPWTELRIFTKNVINCLLNLFVWNSVFQIWIRPDPQLFGLQYLPGFRFKIEILNRICTFIKKTVGNVR